ncbi:MAG: helix-turn-helix domain-containing protein [Bryobacteraceae bacterium]
MSVTGPAFTAEHGQIQRLVNSEVLHGSESLCKLLRYLAERAIEFPGVPAREYQIATEVFGRRPNFDSRLDSTVRVQTGRLRTKLAEYYADQGKDDLIIVEIPRGIYMVSFVHREPAVVEAPAPEQPAFAGAATVAEQPPQPPHLISREWQIASLVLAGCLLVALAFIGFLIYPRPQARTSLDSETLSPELIGFWKVFTTSPEAPWVIFSNAAFIGRPGTGLRYFDPQTDSPEHILDHYTGVGEVLGVHELDSTFALLHHELHVKRGRLVSLDDAKSRNLIFMGSPAENLSLRDWPSTQDFVFKRLDTGPSKGGVSLVNMRPQPGEQAVYAAAPDIPIKEDYALIALARGIDPSYYVLILAGTTTLGTGAAVEYVCHANTLHTLSEGLKHAHGSFGKPFEAVLDVHISAGVPMESDLVAVHAIE